TLILRDADEALTFEATITPEVADTSYGSDVLKLIDAGLAVGLSPGFRLPPERAVKVAEELEDEEYDPANGKYRAIIRNVRQALLFELSIVTSAAYPDAQVEMRNWETGEAFNERLDAGIAPFLRRYPR